MAQQDYGPPARYGRHIAVSGPPIQSLGSGDAASLLWRGDFETGRLDKYRTPVLATLGGGSGRPATPAVVANPAGAGLACRFALLAGDTTTEISPLLAASPVDVRVWMAFSVFLDASFPTDLATTRQYAWEMVTGTAGTFLGGLAVEGGSWKLVLTASDKTVVTPAVRGRTTRFVVEMLHAADPTKGQVVLTVNGTRMLSRTGLATGVPAAEGAAYRVGLRRNGDAVVATQSRSNTGVAYLDDVLIGSSYAAVA